MRVCEGPLRPASPQGSMGVYESMRVHAGPRGFTGVREGPQGSARSARVREGPQGSARVREGPRGLTDPLLSVEILRILNGEEIHSKILYFFFFVFLQKGAYSVLGHYERSYQKALVSLYPDLKLNKKML
jgi:hypothetical protein